MTRGRETTAAMGPWTNHAVYPSRACGRFQMDNQPSRPGDGRRSWANLDAAENSVGESFPPGRRWLRSDLSATASPSPGSFGAPAARGWTESSRFRWKTSVGRSTRSGRRWASIGSSGIGIPGIEKTCGSSRGTESSRRWLARIGFPDAGREKKQRPARTLNMTMQQGQGNANLR